MAEEASFGFDSYLSVFTWRYGSKEMKTIFSEIEYRKLWRKIWVALARAQMNAGLVSREELMELEANKEKINLKRSHEIEREIRHDLMAEVKAFAEQCPKGGGKIHLGATSMDIEDNADVIRMKEALQLIKAKTVNCLDAFNKKILEQKARPCIAFTHLQSAEPSTVGYRLCNYAQELLMDLEQIEFAEENLKGKGFKGAVGTYASYTKLLEGKNLNATELEREVMKELDLKYFDVSTQTYPRKEDFIVLNALSSIAQSLHKFALDFRVLQSTPFSEWMEPFKEKQVGSSAMPFKRNPMNSERICSLTRFVSSMPKIAWDNAANSILERTLDDSANRRIIIAEAFLALDETLIIAGKVIEGMKVNEKQVEKNLLNYGVFAGTEAVLMELVEKGLGRQEAHEIIREHSINAWNSVIEGKSNPLKEFLSGDKRINEIIPRKRIEELLDARKHLGLAEEKCIEFSKKIEKKLHSYRELIGRKEEAAF